MNEKNVVINNYVNSLYTMVNTLVNTLSTLGEIDEINTGVIKTADIEITAINSQIIVLQNALDTYEG